MVIGSAPVQNLRRITAQTAREATIKPEWNDIAGIMCRFARPDIPETRQARWTNGIEVADDRRGGPQLTRNVP